MNLNNYKKVLFIVFLLLIGYHIFLYTQEDHYSIYNNLYGFLSSFIYFIGAIAGLVSVKKFGTSSFVSKSVLFLSLASLVYTIALWIWSYFAIFTEVDIPYPSIADMFYLLFPVFGTIGVVMLLKIYEVKFSKKNTLLLLLLISASAFITNHFIGFPTFDSSEPWISAFDTGFVFGDFVVLSVASIALLLAGGKITSGLFFVILSFFTQGIGDFFFSYQIENDTFWDGNFSDFLFTLSGFFMSLGIISIIKYFQNTNPKAELQQNHQDMEPQLSDPTPRAF